MVRSHRLIDDQRRRTTRGCRRRVRAASFSPARHELLSDTLGATWLHFVGLEAVVMWMRLTTSFVAAWRAESG
jgi:hypothetical protein